MTAADELIEIVEQRETAAERRRRTRGASSKNLQGSAEARRRRKAWLVEEFRADLDVLVVTYPGTIAHDAFAAAADEPVVVEQPATPANIAAAELDAMIYGATFETLPACRCYRCGALLTAATVTPDRRIPGCMGGTYHRNNLRPACGPCNYSTGAKLSRRNRKAKRR